MGNISSLVEFIKKIRCEGEWNSNLSEEFRKLTQTISLDEIDNLTTMSKYYELIEFIKKIKNRSEWGSNLNFENSIKYLAKELCELDQAVSLYDIDNLKAEVCDVFMMTLFTKILVNVQHGMTDNDIINQILSKLESRYAGTLITGNDILPGLEEYFYISNKKNERKTTLANVGLIEVIGDNNKKVLFRLSDNAIIESAVFRHKNENHICLSTQVGCFMGCIHCATTYSEPRFIRNLTYDELNGIIGILLSALDLDSTECVLSLSGHGEALYNYYVIQQFLNDLEIPFKKIYITTVLPKETYTLLGYLRYNSIYISLHGSSDGERKKVLGDNYSNVLDISQVIDLINNDISNNVTIIFNYVMCKHNTKKQSIINMKLINDRLKRAVELRCTNLIKVGSAIKLENASKNAMIKFVKTIDKECNNIAIRFSEIENDNISNIACGQLRAQRMT